MSPITHFLAGWAVAHTAELNPRERMLVTVAGIIPDLDGFGIVVDFATRGATDQHAAIHRINRKIVRGPEVTTSASVCR